VDTTTLYVGTIAWGPVDADPAWAYDTGSGELLFNVYDTLLTAHSTVTHEKAWDVYEEYYNFEPLLAAAVPVRQEVTMTFPNTGINPTDPACYWWNVGPLWYHIDGWIDNNPDGTLGPCDVLYIGEYAQQGMPIREAYTVKTWHVLTFGPTVTVHHYYYNFVMRTSPVITYYDSLGNPVGTFGADDVVHTLRRGLVQDLDGSPMWMYYKPLFDVMGSAGMVGAETANGAWMLAHLIDDAIVNLGNDTVQINIGIAFPDNAFKQILCQMWGSILDKEWQMARTLWDGNLLTDVDANGMPDWYENVRKVVPTLDDITTDNYAGTGPYRVSVASQASNLVVLQRNTNYWRGWPAPGRSAFLEYINIEYIATWTTRRDAFIASQLDVCAVSRAYIGQLLNPSGDPLYPEIKTVKNISPSLSMDAMFFTFTVDPTSPSLYTGVFPTGIPYNFFNNTYVRLAFDYAFNRTAFLAQAWLNEAIVRETPGIFGLVPDYYAQNAVYTPDPPWTYTLDYTKMESNLRLAMFTQLNSTSGLIETHSVWDWGGFKLDVFYNSGNDPRRIACEVLKAGFDVLSATSGKSFVLNIQGPLWSTYINNMRSFVMPVWQIGWLADYADPSNWYGPYMHSYGDFSYFQNYSDVNGWTGRLGARTGMNKDELMDLAIKTPDGDLRKAMYGDLDDIYVAENPSLPTSQPLGRRWSKYWVKGWEFNTLWPSQYYYHLYKLNACWADVTSATIGIEDGRTDMRDIGYIAAHFGAKAPDPSRTPPYDPKWAPGSYGNGGTDVYGDRKVDMRDIGFAAAHFGHQNVP